LAQTVAGRFTLSKDVVWGTVTLTPGEYTYSLEQHGSSLMLLRGLGGGPSFMVLVRSVTSTDSNSDKLVLQRYNDQWVVSDMIIGTIGETLSFDHSNSRLVARKSAHGTDKIASLSKP